MRLILGRSGSGKTTYCMNEVKNYIEEAYSKPLIYIVPEQFSFEAERELIKVIGRNGIINAQVLSFRRLAFKIFAEKGLKENQIGNAGKAMLVYSIMLKHEKELIVLKNVSKNIGLLDTVIKQIEELKRYRITPEILEECNIQNEYLKRKLLDICIIYREYEKAIKEKYMDGNDELNSLAELLKCPTSIDGAKIWIDGFDGFTPQELEIIRALENKTDITVSLIWDKDEVFELNQKTIDKLKKIAKIEDTVLLEDSYRFNSIELKHLEENFMRYPYKKYNEDVENIVLTLNKNPQNEVETIACKIQEYVKNSGYRYEDIAILTRDTQSYKNLFQTYFKLYQIPFFLDDKRELYTQPIVALVLSLIDICIHNFSYESVFNYLKTGLTNIQDKDDICILENYVLKYGIRGNDWQKEWTLKDDNLEKINILREQVINPIVYFKHDLNNRKTTKEIVEALYQYLINIKAYDSVQCQVEKLKENNNLALASEYAQVWNILMSILDEMVQMIGNESISFERFSSVLKIGIDNHEIGIIPPSKDQVMIGDIERTKSANVKVLFVLGLNDGVFPKAYSDEGFINDGERNLLLDNGIEIAKDTKKLLVEENFNIYKAFSVASDRIHISYPVANFEGKALRPSFIIQNLKNIFPKLVEKSNLINDDLPIVNENSAFSHLLRKIRSYTDDGIIDEKWKDVYVWFSKNDNEELEKICQALNYKNTVEYMSNATMKRLYGDNISGSVSKLEKFVSCPFSFYLKYGLNAKKREVYKLDNPDIGSFLHEIIDKFSKYILENDISLREITKEESDSIVDRIVDESINGFRNNLLNSSTRMKQLSIKLKRLVKRMIWVITMQIRSGKFEIVGNEVEFGKDKSYPAIEVMLSDGSNLVLNGKVDRIDIAQTEDGKYIRIIDYKSSSKQIKLSDVFYGVQLQLLTYLDAVSDEETIPGGVLYLELNDPMIKSNCDLLPEEVEKEIMKQLRMKGLILADVKLIKAMDCEIEKESKVLNLSVKKDGTFSKMPTATEEQFSKLRNHIRSVLKQIGDEIINGNVNIEPCKRKTKTPCGYCEYKEVCQFDKQLGNNYNVINELSDEEVWERISNNT